MGELSKAAAKLVDDQHANEVASLRAEVARERSRADSLAAEVAQLRRTEDLSAAVQSVKLSPPKWAKPTTKKSAAKRATACLLVSDVRDLVALRLDEMMASLFGLNNLPAALGDDKTKYQGERYLLRYLRAFSYFRRLDLLEDRGRRPAVHQDDASPRGMDR